MFCFFAQDYVSNKPAFKHYLPTVGSIGTAGLGESGKMRSMPGRNTYMHCIRFTGSLINSLTAAEAEKAAVNFIPRNNITQLTEVDRQIGEGALKARIKRRAPEVE